MRISGANPIEFITHKTGDWTIRFLLITLAVTPLRGLLNQPQLIRFRRMLGLFAFFYGFLHFMTWVWLDQFFDLGGMLKDVAKRPFITAGFTAFMLLTPLAVTSTAGWVRRLGYRRWQNAAPADLFQRVGSGDSLLLASQIRYPATAAVWSDSYDPAPLSVDRTAEKDSIAAGRSLNRSNRALLRSTLTPSS